MIPRPSLLRIARERGVPLDPDDRRRLALIDRHGWAVMHIFDPDELVLPFSFSVGLSHGFAHPEVIVVGLDREVSHVLVNEIGNRVRDGERLVDGATRDDLLQGATAWSSGRCIPPAIPRTSGPRCGSTIGSIRGAALGPAMRLARPAAALSMGSAGRRGDSQTAALAGGGAGAGSGPIVSP